MVDKVPLPATMARLLAIIVTASSVNSLQIPNGANFFRPEIPAIGSFTRSVSISNFVYDPSSNPVSPKGNKHTSSTRRKWFTDLITTASIATTTIAYHPKTAYSYTDNDPSTPYENPNIPPGPEERSGLVILRVAEVAQFQEKILRSVANGELPPDIVVSPQQVTFGTKILLKNSNIAGNMKLMIETEVPRSRRDEAARNAVVVMNTLQNVYATADEIKRPFTKAEMLQVADLYRDVRLQLNAMYEYLPQREKDKYYGYFMKVTEYEKKIAEGVYNPDIDGVLKLDYD